MAETDFNITTIGLEVGYDTLSTFNRNFRRLVERTPSAFRAERRFADPASSKRMRQVDMGGKAQCLSEFDCATQRTKALVVYECGRARVADTPPSIV